MTFLAENHIAVAHYSRTFAFRYDFQTQFELFTKKCHLFE